MFPESRYLWYVFCSWKQEMQGCQMVRNLRFVFVTLRAWLLDQLFINSSNVMEISKYPKNLRREISSAPNIQCPEVFRLRPFWETVHPSKVMDFIHAGYSCSNMVLGPQGDVLGQTSNRRFFWEFSMGIKKRSWKDYVKPPRNHLVLRHFSIF